MRAYELDHAANRAKDLRSQELRRRFVAARYRLRRLLRRVFPSASNCGAAP